MVTDSFHGCVFSIIFGKPFVAVANSWRGTNRFTSLLAPLGLVDRLVFNLEEYYQRRELLLKPIDYTKVNSLLDTQSTYSLNFLKNALA